MAVLRRQDLLARGLTPNEVRLLVANGDLERVRHGVLATAQPTRLTLEQQHTRLVLGTWAGLRPGAVLSHVSAAVLHELPVPRSSLSRVWITRPGRGGKSSQAVRLVRGDLSDDEVVRIGRIDVTSLLRTTVDLLSRLSFTDGVILADAAVRRGVNLAELVQALERSHIKGVLRARQAARFADGRSESAGESLSRVIMARGGLEIPELQFVIQGQHGTIARTDFAWQRHRTVGEFDGKIKYGVDPASADPTRALFAEKQREDRIRAEGWWPVRWVWADLAEPAVLCRRITRAFADADRFFGLGTRTLPGDPT